MPSDPKNASSAAVYARFSSENQSDASIDDQVRVCRRYAELQGFTVAAVYADPAISGASTLRPGYQKLLEDARNGVFEVIIAEGLDRLSRDLADVALLYKHLSYLGIRIVTVQEGLVNDLHVGLKGTMNAIALKEIALKTHRGLEGESAAACPAAAIPTATIWCPGKPGSGRSTRPRPRS